MQTNTPADPWPLCASKRVGRYIIFAWCIFLALASTTFAEPFRFRTVDDRELALDADKVQATTFVFVTDVCPIANSYQPRLRELQSEYERQGIQFVLVYPMPSITKETVARHRSDFDIKASCVIDSDLSLAKRLGAKVTPEAIVVDRAGKVLYRGRIDDQHAALGKKRPQASQHDLANALKAITTHQSVPVTETTAIGCVIRYNQR